MHTAVSPNNSLACITEIKKPPQPISKDTYSLYTVEAEHGLNDTGILLALVQVHVKIHENHVLSADECSYSEFSLMEYVRVIFQVSPEFQSYRYQCKLAFAPNTSASWFELDGCLTPQTK